MGNTNEAEALKSIAMPFPPYNAQNPTLWFRQIESCFYCTGVKDEMTKYHILVSRLEPDVAELVQDFIGDNGSETDKYNQLKTRIIANQETKNILENQPIGERKPSEILRHIQQIASENRSFPAHLVRSIWISSLSSCVKDVLLNNQTISRKIRKIKNTEKLGILADMLHTEAQKKSEEQAKHLLDEMHCSCCKQGKKVTLEVNCVKLCEAMENMDLKKTETCGNSTQTTLW